MSGLRRGSWIWHPDLQCLVPKAQYLLGKHNQIARSDVPFPAIRSDGMDAIKSMADGRIYESKSAYYKSVRRAGCEIVGHDKHWTEHIKPQLPDDKSHEAEIAVDVKRSIAELESR